MSFGAYRSDDHYQSDNRSLCDSRSAFCPQYPMYARCVCPNYEIPERIHHLDPLAGITLLPAWTNDILGMLFFSNGKVARLLLTILLETFYPGIAQANRVLVDAVDVC